VALAKLFPHTIPVLNPDQATSLQSNADNNAYMLLGMTLASYGTGGKEDYIDHKPTREARQKALKNGVANAYVDEEGRISGSEVAETIDVRDNSLLSPIAIIEDIPDGGLNKLANNIAEQEPQSPKEMEERISSLEKTIVPVSLEDSTSAARKATKQDAQLVRRRIEKRKLRLAA